MPRILFIFFLLVNLFTAIHAQVFRYIGIEDGLSSRRVISIEQGVQDYIWILTHKGVDRYDGKFFNHYTLRQGHTEINFYPDLNRLKVDENSILWEYGKDGYIFRYDEMGNEFILQFSLKDSIPNLKNKPITEVYFDSKQRIWFCAENTLVVYDTRNHSYFIKGHFLEGEVSSMTEGRDNHYFFATSKYVYTCTFDGKEIKQTERHDIKNIRLINTIYCHKPTNQLIINTLLSGMYLMDLKNDSITFLSDALKDVGLNTVKPYKKEANEVLIATDGDGIYKLNFTSKKLSHFLKEDYRKWNKMNGSIVKDICMDKSNRIWSVIYPTGITVYTEKYESFEWIRQGLNAQESLVDNRINAILQDSTGDIWYATNNGISCFNPQNNRWKTYLSDKTNDAHNGNHIFISLCEAAPGVILAGGYMSGTYFINKHSGKVSYTLQETVEKGINPDKYIRSIHRDRKGMIWAGGYYSLRSYDYEKNFTQWYRTIYPITCIRDKEENFLWIGTINGLYTFNKITKSLLKFPLNEEPGCVNAIYQTPNDSLTYVATYGKGLFVIDNTTNQTKHYHKHNSGLITNNIYSILPNKWGNFFLGTENGLALFDVKEGHATHWTREQGLQAFSFNQNAAIRTHKGFLIFGTNNGAISISDSMTLPKDFASHMVFENLNIMYRNVRPNRKDSPLKTQLDNTSKIRLKYNQNTFSLNVNSINFDNPSHVLYSWKLEGFYDEWSTPSNDNLIRYTNLWPGTYNLRVRAQFSDNPQYQEERSIRIIVERPFWLTNWAFLAYILILLGTLWAILRYQMIRKDRQSSAEKIKFFIQTAHDIRTPLTLIKAPLGEILKKEELTHEGVMNINLAIQNAENLSELANNLMNFQKEEFYSPQVMVQKEELNEYIQNCLKCFTNYAEQKDLELNYNSDFDKLEVWIDTNKMDSILRNLLTNALKYTPKGGKISIEATHTKHQWSLTITDTGIGIPTQDQKKLFKFFFRGKNANKHFIAGSGIGMLLTHRLILNHQGKISFYSKENSGTSFHLTFPIKSNRYYYKQKEDLTNDITSAVMSQNQVSVLLGEPQLKQNESEYALRVLIVEDNSSLRLFLQQALADTYYTMGAENGAEALEIIKREQPDLILSDIMMPVMDGYELCRRVKNDVETCHIPIILLTALNDKDQIISGLESKADYYVVKPFDLTVLRANISNVLNNREVMRKRLQKSIIAKLKASGEIKLDGEEKLANISNGDSKDEEELFNELDNQFIEEVAALIRKGLGKGVNVDTLSADVNMSRSSFYKKIKALTGMAPAELIRNIRMEEAGQLLKSKKYSVAEVSSMLGFADPKYFTDTFKRHYGMPPSVYMKQN